MKSIEKIAYIVPSETMMESVKNILAEEIREGVIDVLMIDVSNVEGEYLSLCGKGYSCIIARGGTYTDLKQYEDIIPVIEERIRTSDILEMLSESSIGDDETAYVVIHQNTANGAENFSGITGGNVQVLRYRDLWELRQILDDIPETNVRVFSSGYAAVLSDREDLRFIELRNRPHSVRETVKNARVFLSRMQDNIKQVNTLNSIYNNIDEGIILFDTAFRIMEGNDRALRFLGMTHHEVIDKAVYELIPEMPQPGKDGQCSIDSPRTFTGRQGKYQISYTVYPFDFYRGKTSYILVMQDVTKIQSLERNIRLQLTKKGLVAEHRFEDILTCDPGMQHVIGTAHAIACHEGSVLIYGESGTGKELFAQSIHNESSRRSGPFVAINCAALTESLLESELFGYVGGAFTGARKEGKAGLFELAHNGTIFLDEIGDRPIALQSRLLRVIENGEIEKIGRQKSIPVDVRIIAATNQPLEKMIREKQFRMDLFYRLNVISMSIPALRDRKEDIPVLADYFLREFCSKYDRERSISEKGYSRLVEREWLGNVRELRNCIERAVILSEGETLDFKDLASSAAKESDAAGMADSAGGKEWTALSDMKLEEALAACEESCIRQALKESGGNRAEAIRRLGISRRTFYRKCAQYGILDNGASGEEEL